MKLGLDTNIPFSHQPEVCQWDPCNKPLGKLLNVWKGQNSKRWYCCVQCLMKGEEANIVKVAAAAGRVS